ncbi:MAG TPA: DUF2490 domain-containing protein [Puia sp.]|nr:DUF2490 domain-containing protein [Puia sp.]
MKSTLQLTLLVIFLTIIGIRPAHAQTQFTGWLATFQNYKLSPKWGFYFDIQYRSTDQWKQMHSLLIRPGISYYFKPNLIGTVGYAVIPQQRISGTATGYLPESRFWEQFIVSHNVHLSNKARTTAVQHRFRLEQRSIPKFHSHDGAIVHDKHVYTGRFRYFTRAVIPFAGVHTITAPATGLAANTPAAPSRAFTQGFFAAVQNEIFLNIGDASPVNGKVFDQNRAYMAVGYRCSKQFDVEMGYLNQYISGAGNSPTNNHVLQVATYVRL